MKETNVTFLRCLKLLSLTGVKGFRGKSSLMQTKPMSIIFHIHTLSLCSVDLLLSFLLSNSGTV